MPKTLQFLNYNLASDYVNNRSVWLNDIPGEIRQHNQLYICPLHLVKNLKSNSTPLRVTQAGNTTVRSLCGLHCPCKTSPAKTSDTDLNDRTWVRPNEETWVRPNEEACVRSGSDRTQDRQQPIDNDDKISTDGDKKGGTPEKCKATLTLNSTIPDIHCTIPRVADIALCSRLSIVNSGSDISRFFRL